MLDCCDDPQRNEPVLPNLYFSATTNGNPGAVLERQSNHSRSLNLLCDRGRTTMHDAKITPMARQVSQIRTHPLTLSPANTTCRQSGRLR